MPGQHKFLAIAAAPADNLKSTVWWCTDFGRPEPDSKVFDVYSVGANAHWWWHPSARWTKVQSGVRYPGGVPPRAKVHVFVFAAPGRGVDVYTMNPALRSPIGHWWSPLDRQWWLSTKVDKWEEQPWPAFFDPYNGPAGW
jgi:hypothetical protein